MTELERLADDDFAYLTTIGRRTGRPHTIEIWFAAHGHTVYMLSGGGRTSDWCRNLMSEPRVTFRIGVVTFAGSGRLVTDPEEDARARDFVAGKYQPRYRGSLKRWKRASTPFAVDLEGIAPNRPERQLK